MIVERFPELAKLSVEEKKRLIDELWQEVSGSETEEPDPELVRLLEQRWRAYERNPETAMTIEEFRHRIGVFRP